jgi:hypothetical protein
LFPGGDFCKGGGVKICALGIPGLTPGRHLLKDPRLDLAHQLIKADKKTYAAVDLVDASGMAEADAIVAAPEQVLALIIDDIEFVETRLSRDPEPAERAVLAKILPHLESEQPVCRLELTEAERGAFDFHALRTGSPLTVASAAELEDPGSLLLRAFRESGQIVFLTVGGKENRAWPLPAGSTAWEAAGCIHSDIQKGFIRAEVISFADFIEAGGEVQAKRANKLRLENKTYVIADCDLVNFRFGK